MNKFLEGTFKVCLTLAVLLFSLIMVFEFISQIDNEYRYAVIGAIGSLIGGSLTLVGVWWTLRNQLKINFMNDFPKKIRILDELKNRIHYIIDQKIFFKDIYYPNQTISYNQIVDELKVLTTDVDGTSYFIICKLENLFEKYSEKVSALKEYEKDKQNQFGDPILTKKSIKNLNDLTEEYKLKFQDIIKELEIHGENVTKQFFKYRGKI